MLPVACVRLTPPRTRGCLYTLLSFSATPSRVYSFNNISHYEVSANNSAHLIKTDIAYPHVPEHKDTVFLWLLPVKTLSPVCTLHCLPIDPAFLSLSFHSRLKPLVLCRVSGLGRMALEFVRL